MPAYATKALTIALLCGVAATSAHAACTPMPFGPNAEEGHGRILREQLHATPLFRALSQGGFDLNTWSCAGAGDACGTDASGNHILCVDDNPNLTCDKKTHTCTSDPPLNKVYNMSCQPPPPGKFTSTCDDVLGGAQLDCNEGHCIFNNAKEKHLCTFDIECGSGQCVNGQCKAAALGEACHYGGCTVGSYCKFDTKSMKMLCAPKLPVDSDCGGANVMNCIEGTACNRATNKCEKLWSVADGKNVSAYASMLCGSGFVKVEHPNDQFGTCAHTDFGPIGTSCTGPKDGMMCMCPINDPTATTGVLLPFGTGVDQVTGKALTKCLAASGCPYDASFGMVSPEGAGSCSYYACYDEYIATQCAQIIGMYGGTSRIENTLRNLGFPDCAVTAGFKYFGTMAACEKYQSQCQTMPDGRGKCV